MKQPTPWFCALQSASCPKETTPLPWIEHAQPWLEIWLLYSLFSWSSVLDEFLRVLKNSVQNHLYRLLRSYWKNLLIMLKAWFSWAYKRLDLRCMHLGIPVIFRPFHCLCLAITALFAVNCSKQMKKMFRNIDSLCPWYDQITRFVVHKSCRWFHHISFPPGSPTYPLHFIIKTSRSKLDVSVPATKFHIHVFPSNIPERLFRSPNGLSFLLVPLLYIYISRLAAFPYPNSLNNWFYFLDFLLLHYSDSNMFRLQRRTRSLKRKFPKLCISIWFKLFSLTILYVWSNQ